MDSYLRVLRRCYGAYCDRFQAVAEADGRAGKVEFKVCTSHCMLHET